MVRGLPVSIFGGYPTASCLLAAVEACSKLANKFLSIWPELLVARSLFHVEIHVTLFVNVLPTAVTMRIWDRVFVTGTDTGIGKTVVSAALMAGAGPEAPRGRGWRGGARARATALLKEKACPKHRGMPAGPVLSPSGAGGAERMPWRKLSEIVRGGSKAAAAFSRLQRQP